MRQRLSNTLAVIAVVAAILLLGFTAVVPRPLAALSNEIPTFADGEFERPSYTLRLLYDAVSARAAGCEAEGRAGKQAHGPAIMVTLPAGRVTGRAEHSTALGDALRDGLDRKAPVSSIHGASVTTQRMIAEPVFRRVSPRTRKSHSALT